MPCVLCVRKERVQSRQAGDDFIAKLMRRTTYKYDKTMKRRYVEDNCIATEKDKQSCWYCKVRSLVLVVYDYFVLYSYSPTLLCMPAVPQCRCREAQVHEKKVPNVDRVSGGPLPPSPVLSCPSFV